VPRFGLGIVHPGEPHASPPHPITDEVSVYQVLYLPPEMLTATSARRPEPPPFLEHDLRDERLSRLFRAVFDALTGGGEAPATRLETDSLLLSFSQGLARQGGIAADIPSPERGPGASVRRARAYLHERADDEVPLDELAAAAGVSASYLCRAFREATGLSPHRYHYLLRVDRAKKLLARGVAPGEAAAAVGFAHQSHLGVHFKRVVGTTPGAYARAVSSTHAPPAKRPGSRP
jgi:AraC-like DNA-binding protein